MLHRDMCENLEYHTSLLRVHTFIRIQVHMLPLIYVFLRVGESKETTGIQLQLLKGGMYIGKVMHLIGA